MLQGYISSSAIHLAINRLSSSKNGLSSSKNVLIINYSRENGLSSKEDRINQVRITKLKIIAVYSNSIAMHSKISYDESNKL